MALQEAPQAISPGAEDTAPVAVPVLLMVNVAVPGGDCESTPVKIGFSVEHAAANNDSPRPTMTAIRAERQCDKLIHTPSKISEVPLLDLYVAKMLMRVHFLDSLRSSTIRR